MILPKRMVRTLPTCVPAGIAATLTMDAAMVLAGKFAPGVFATDSVGLEVIGRWAGGLGRGRWRHVDITTSPRLRGELAMGLSAHYLTGIVLTDAYLVLLRRGRLRPGLVTATAYGLATSVLPLLVLYPSLGYGFCGRRNADAARLACIMLLGHTAFGVGIGLWTGLRGRRVAAE